MLRFPVPSSERGVPLRRMTLIEYARFSEHCLRANSAVTPENCLTKRADEVRMQPFTLDSFRGPATEH